MDFEVRQERFRSQDGVAVELDLKMENGWATSVLQGGAELSIPAFGFRCLVADLYRKTPLAPRPSSERRP